MIRPQIELYMSLIEFYHKILHDLWKLIGKKLKSRVYDIYILSIFETKIATMIMRDQHQHHD